MNNVKEKTEQLQFTVNKVTVEYIQEADSNDSNTDQFLELSTDDAGAGVYYVLKTDRWAFDDPKELIDILNDFIKRI